MPKGNPKRPTPRFPREAIVLRFLAGEEHFSRLSPRITAYDIVELERQGFHVLKEPWDDERKTAVYRPDDLTAWRANYDRVIGELPVKRPVGRPTGIKNPKAGRKPEKTWEQRHQEDPEGASGLHLLLPHRLGRLLEAEAKREGVSIPALAERAIDRWVEERESNDQTET